MFLTRFRGRNGQLIALILVLAALAGCATIPKGPAKRAVPAGLEKTALDDYVAKPDPSYTYSLANTVKGEGYTAYMIDMTSQTWRTPQEVDQPVWKHWVTIVKPDTVKSHIGFLYINGGHNGSPAPNKADAGMIEIAKKTGTVVTELNQIPSEPLTFAGETKPRSEDGIIAYTWIKYMMTGDPTWLARFPMTKASVRAMDTITKFCATPEAGNAVVDQFVVCGGSKRGWTTWTTAAVDKRVIAIVPAVINMLNLIPSFEHHWAAYGFWAPAVGDYVREGVMDWMGTPEYDALLKLVEPYSYRGRYTMPKLILNATGDEFFLPDSTRYYLKDLPGETHLRDVPNAKHGLDGTDALQSVMAFYSYIVSGTARPTMVFENKNGVVTLKTKDKPTSVKLWQAANAKARDFRVDTIGRVWTSTDVPEHGSGVYTAKVPKPEKGWTAYMLEASFTSPAGVPLKMTTEVYVIPDTLPFKYSLPENKKIGFIQQKMAGQK